MIMIDKAVVQKVWRELDEMKKLGVAVPKFSYVVAGQEATSLHGNGASISDIADLCLTLG
jgi:hypothetical protein